MTAAFAAEACLYAACGIESARKALEERLGRLGLALSFTLSALVPYSIYAVPTGMFRWKALAALAALAAAVSFWYIVLPRRPAVDIVFIAFIAAVLLADVFPRIYLTPERRIPLVILGQLMWTRVSILAALSIARMDVKGFGFLPARKELAAGFLNFALFAPFGLVLGWALHVAPFHPRPLEGWQVPVAAALMFMGMLWVVALREEFFFRGLLQEWLGAWTRNERAGLAIASMLFGLIHLWFRGFPNWRFAAMAAVAGVFYGRAYLTTRSVRAAMVTHALVNTAWRVLFS